MSYIIILLMQLIIAGPVVTINKTQYTLDDFYQEYGKKEWLDAKLQQKNDLIDDFINRRVATLQRRRLACKTNLILQGDYIIDIILN